MAPFTIRQFLDDSGVEAVGVEPAGHWPFSRSARRFCRGPGYFSEWRLGDGSAKVT